MATAAVCLALGGLGLLKRSEFLELRLGKTVEVRGRLVRVLGPEDMHFSFRVDNHDDHSYHIPGYLGSTGFSASRSWFSIYDIAATFDRPTEPGRYEYALVGDGQPGPRAILSVKQPMRSSRAAPRQLDCRNGKKGQPFRRGRPGTRRAARCVPVQRRASRPASYMGPVRRGR